MKTATSMSLYQTIFLLQDLVLLCDYLIQFNRNTFIQYRFGNNILLVLILVLYNLFFIPQSFIVNCIFQEFN